MKSLELWKYRISCLRATKPYSLIPLRKHRATITPHAQGLEKETDICVKDVLYRYGWKVPETFTLKDNRKNPSVYHLALERPMFKMQLFARNTSGKTSLQFAARQDFPTSYI